MVMVTQIAADQPGQPSFDHEPCHTIAAKGDSYCVIMVDNPGHSPSKKQHLPGLHGCHKLLSTTLEPSHTISGVKLMVKGYGCLTLIQNQPILDDNLKARGVCHATWRLPGWATPQDC